ncbi:beta-lactamase family protein [Bacillus cereus group sp. Bc005]|nr:MULTISPECIES: beta-lactamase family protein [unclassified Bacillus cereus group]MED1216144.1 beta-lactamase family protein [Bacillus paranthracis]MDA1617308.1 beta-lactamase family protein [Bacillus cereus group sp. TH204-1LC]MDA2157632.1 beta-lactamase family protein [Bacillus cereus group sp. Bc253]MDA2195098.1 beta-lactamase family protein [Bacillus cereus group sp. Bc238]MDA2200889.1 beta-lactamase family protein [Bacillus cereus group sp. Bc237]
MGNRNKRMKIYFERLIAVSVCFLLFFLGSNYSKAETVAPITLNPKDVEAFTNKVIPEKMKKENAAGVALVVVKDNQILFQKGFGFSDKEKNTPIDPKKTVFRLASISKVFTASAVMQLVEQGKIDLNKDIVNYMGGLKYQNNMGEPVTMEHLLTHTTGFDYVDPRPEDIHYQENDYTMLKDYVEDNMPTVVRKPGDTYTYDNFASMLQGYIVQNLTNTPFYKYMAKNIFYPLEMHNSSFVMTNFIKEKLATGYDAKGNVIPFYQTRPTDMPQGSMFSTGSDVANFMIAQLNDGKFKNNQILQKETVEDMQKTKFALHPKYPNMTYGFEFFSPQSHNGQYVFGKGGNIPGFSSLMWLIPEHKIGVFVVTNKDSSALPVEVFDDFMNQYFPDKTKPEYLKPNEEELKKFEGVYRDLRLKNLMSHVNISEGKLYVSDKAYGKQELKQIDPLLFEDEKGNYMAFKLHKDGTVKEMIHWNSGSSAMKLSEPERFKDVDENHPYAKFINPLHQYEVLQANKEGNFTPESSLTRAEFAYWLSQIAYFTPPSKKEPVFSDVKNHPYAPHIQKLYEIGILYEKEGEQFHPDRAITRQEAAWITWQYLKMLGAPSADATLKGETDDWAIESVKNIVGHRLVGPEVIYNEDGSADYLSKQSMKRQEAAALLFYVLLSS